MQENPIKIAYFSMEIALESAIPTYSGGLGVLAGDTLRSAADLGVPIVGVTLVHCKGYFHQRLDAHGHQFEEDAQWRPEELLEESDARAVVEIEGRQVCLRAWKYTIRGISGHEVPVFLLDSDLSENTSWDKTLTDHLYGGDAHYRLCQEALLGMGGVRLLRELSYTHITSYHMNEGHASLLALGLLEERLGRSELGSATQQDIEAVRSQCIFTTHTPVPAGHDQFSRTLMQQILGAQRMKVLEVTRCCPEGTLNMTYLALKFSRYINGVAMHHGEISHEMFPPYSIHAITNGVHAVTWTAPAFRELYDLHIPEWRRDNLYLRYVRGISLDEIRQAHASAKRALLQEIHSKMNVEMNEGAFTIGFARRAATYKRPDLLFANGDRLRRISKEDGPLQIVFGGKAHPQDAGGKELIRRVVETAGFLKDAIRFVYVQDYDMKWAQLITSGVDLWLNTPRKPLEASGTSGMKAALNGVPSLSVLDGWWIEGHAEGATGWAITADGGCPGRSFRGVYLSLQQARRDDLADILWPSVTLCGNHAFNHRIERFVLQCAANGLSVRGECLFSREGRRRAQSGFREQQWSLRRIITMQNSSTRRARARFGDWMPGSAILLLISVLLLAGPLYGQESNGTAHDPFDSVQKRLELAADAQLAFAHSPNPPVANALPHAAAPAALVQSRPIELPTGKPPSTGTDSEQRFRALGLDAGKILTEVGLPLELLGVARLESNINPFAVSPKGAVGLWQLMPATARRYGLQVDAYRDDRLDAEKSTRAAARYLRDLHAQFGSWDLALAGYNAGEDAVERAIKRTKTRNFNLLAQARMLPLETRNYVPTVLKIMGAARGASARHAATGTTQSAKAAIVYAASYVENQR